MVINALNSGAQVFMADFEDATSPTWENLIEGQVNLRDCWRRHIAYTDPDSGKHYRARRQIRRSCWFARAAGTSPKIT